MNISIDDDDDGYTKSNLLTAVGTYLIIKLKLNILGMPKTGGEIGRGSFGFVIVSQMGSFRSLCREIRCSGGREELEWFGNGIPL